MSSVAGLYQGFRGVSVVKWEQVRLDFAYDGALRDIYVLGTDLPDWQAVLDIMRTFIPPPIFMVDAAVSDLPYNAETILNLRTSNSTHLKIFLGACKEITALV